MRKAVNISVCCLLTSGLIAGQPIDPNAPPGREPKTPPRKPTPRELPVPEPEELLGPEGEAEVVPELKGIVIVKSLEEVNPEGLPGVRGVVVNDVPLLMNAAFRDLLEPYFGKPAKFKTIKRMERQIILFCRDHYHPLVDVVLPAQDPKDGVIQFVFIEAKVGKVTVNNPGKDFFKDALILRQIRVQPGQTVNSRDLLADLDWLNRNPFRDARVTFRQGEAVGQSDIELQVNDRFPVRGYLGYENTGTEFTGPDRLLAGVNWGNVFGWDHQLNYQYTTDLDFDLVKAHSASYVAPFPWHHTLVLLGSYVNGTAEFTSDGEDVTATGRSYQASLRYLVPLTAFRTMRHDVSLGFDFKRSNNNFEFGGLNVTENDVDILQFEAGYSMTLPDDWGQTSVGVETYYSPGDLTSRNENEDFKALSGRADTPAHYIYARLNAERLTRLPLNFSWVLRLQGQLADHNLLPSEQLGLGGYSTVRGYEERLHSGDEGIIINNELRTPPWKIGGLFPDGTDFLQGLAFFDYGTTSIHDPDPTVDENPHPTLYSVGAGVRWTASTHISFRFDYGWALTERDLIDKNARAHIGALVSF
jgi:hemolysin activation/secretion protein